MPTPVPAHDEIARTDRVGPALAAATGDERWLDVRAELVSGGKSNLTFLLSSPAGELVLRRPPPASWCSAARHRRAAAQRARHGA